MESAAFVPHLLREGKWSPCAVSVPTLEEALGLVEVNFRHHHPDTTLRQAFGDSPDLLFRVCRTDPGGWNPTIVEVLKSADAEMATLAVYKILEGRWRGD